MVSTGKLYWVNDTDEVEITQVPYFVNNTEMDYRVKYVPPSGLSTDGDPIHSNIAGVTLVFIDEYNTSEIVSIILDNYVSVFIFLFFSF